MDCENFVKGCIRAGEIWHLCAITTRVMGSKPCYTDQLLRPHDLITKIDSGPYSPVCLSSTYISECIIYLRLWVCVCLVHAALCWLLGCLYNHYNVGKVDNVKVTVCGVCCRPQTRTIANLIMFYSFDFDLRDACS